MSKIDSGGTISIAEMNSKNTAVGINKNMASQYAAPFEKEKNLAGRRPVLGG